MDPISAISLASSIITFIDFTWKLASGSEDLEIYEQNEAVRVNTHDLQIILKKLGQDVGAATETERNTAILAKKCQRDSDELCGMLEILQLSPGTSTKSIRKRAKVTLSSVWDRRKLDQLKERLQDYRSEITAHLTWALK